MKIILIKLLDFTKKLNLKKKIYEKKLNLSLESFILIL